MPMLAPELNPDPPPPVEVSVLVLDVVELVAPDEVVVVESKSPDWCFTMTPNAFMAPLAGYSYLVADGFPFSGLFVMVRVPVVPYELTHMSVSFHGWNGFGVPVSCAENCITLYQISDHQRTRHIPPGTWCATIYVRRTTDLARLCQSSNRIRLALYCCVAGRTSAWRIVCRARPIVVGRQAVACCWRAEEVVPHGTIAYANINLPYVGRGEARR